MDAQSMNSAVTMDRRRSRSRSRKSKQEEKLTGKSGTLVRVRITNEKEKREQLEKAKWDGLRAERERRTQERQERRELEGREREKKMGRADRERRDIVGRLEREERERRGAREREERERRERKESRERAREETRETVRMRSAKSVNRKLAHGTRSIQSQQQSLATVSLSNYSITSETKTEMLKLPPPPRKKALTGRRQHSTFERIWNIATPFPDIQIESAVDEKLVRTPAAVEAGRVAPRK